MNKTFHKIGTTALLMLIVLSSAQITFGEQKITDIGKYKKIGELTYSPDSKSFSFTVTKDGKTHIIKDGVDLGVGIDPLYSPDSKSFTYIKYDNPNDQKYHVIKDGIDLGLSASPNYSPDSKSFAYVSMKNGKYHVIKDGIDLGTGGLLTTTFSPDSNSFSYVTSGAGGYYRLIKDGIDLGTLNQKITNIFYSPDSKSFAYISGDKNIIKDGVNLGMGMSVVYSPDSKSFAYEAIKNGKEGHVIKDGVDLGISGEPNYSPDSKSFAYILQKNGAYHVIKDGVDLGVGELMQKNAYSPDSKSFVYNNTKNLHLIKDGEDLGVGGLFVYSPDSKSYAYVVVKDGKNHVIKDGTDLGVGNYPTYSSDSNKFAYVSKNDDGTYSVVQLIKDGTISSDSSNMNIGTTDNNKKPLKVLTDSQKNSLNRTIASFSKERLNEILNRITVLSSKSGISSRNLDFLDDIRNVLQEKLNTLK